MTQCFASMNENDLCEADNILPDGNTNFEMNNCYPDWDVFKCVRGKI